MLESSFSRVRFVFLVQGKDWSSVGKLIFKSSIRFLGSKQRLIKCWKAHFQEFDSFSWFRATTDRVLESSFSRVRFVFLVQGNDWRKRIELLKMSFPTLDQSLLWTKKTNRTLENELSNTRSVVALNQENESNSWKWAYQHSISRCPEPRKRIELLKMSLPTLDQSLPWTKKTNRTLENELSNTSSVVALNQENESNSWKWAFQHSISRCFEPRKRIELLKMSFPTLDQSLPWTKKTNRTLENELSNIRSVVALNQENESNSWKWAFQHSISRCPEPRKRIELLKMSFPTFDQSLPWTKKTNRTLENELTNTRSVVALNQENESNSWKWAFQHSISRCPEPRKRIELLKMSLPTLDQSLLWTKKTNRTLENELSNTRSVVALNQENESNSWKWAFQHSISRCPEPRKRIELLKMSLPILDQSLPWTKKTNRTLENELTNTRSVVALNQENESNSWKWAFQHSISRCPEPRKRIELLKMSLPTLDQSLPWTKKTNRTLENELSNTRSVVALNQENESNSWKWAFQHSISPCPEPRKRIELLKMSLPTLDQSLPWTKKTNRTLENELTNIRSVVALNQENESNSWKWAFQHSISRCFEPRKRIELLKMSFPTLDQSLPWTKKTNRTLENELSNIRSVVALNQENESNSWKWAFQHSISRCPEPRKRIELLKMSFPTFDQSLPWTKKTNRTLENELSNTRSVVALNQENESNSWKWAFQHSISRCPEPRKRIELLKMSFPTLDQSLPWTKKTNRTLENELSNTRSVVALNQGNESNSWKWAFQHCISRCFEPRKRIELLKMSFPTLDQSLPWTIECWKAHFQEFDSFYWFRATTDRVLESSFSEFDSFSWFRATTDRVLESSFSRVRFVSWFRATTEENESNSENELSNTRSVVALNHRVLESSFSRVRFVFLVQGKDWSNVGKLIFKSSIRFIGSGQRLIECWKAHFQEFDSFSWFRATTDRVLESSFSRVRFVFLVQSNDWRKRIELLKMSFPTLDQSLPWTKKTNRTLENELSNTRSVVALNQENESNSWKWAFQHSISRCFEPSSVGKLIFKSSIRLLVQGNDWSSVGKLIFKSSIRFLGSGQRLIECWKAHFQEFDSFSWFRATTDRVLESSFSRVRFVFLVQGKD